MNANVTFDPRVAMMEHEALQRRVRFLSLAVLLLFAGWLFTLVRPAHAAAAPASLVLRRLAIVDARGVERVVLSAPAPDVMMNGKLVKREGQASGMIIYDSSGKERGGYLTSDEASNGAMLTLDGANDTQVITLYANPTGGATLSLNNEKGDGAALTTWQRPVIQLRQGKQILFKQPAGAPDLH